jgi:hypothetical protein
MKKNDKLDMVLKDWLKNHFGNNISLGKNFDQDDMKGIDGHLNYDNKIIPISLRNRDTTYGIDSVSFTVWWKNKKQGEWYYSQEQARIHSWSNIEKNGTITIQKIVLVDSKKILLNKDYWEKVSIQKNNRFNGQTFILLDLKELYKQDLIIKELL